jgi:NinB protein
VEQVSRGYIVDKCPHCAGALRQRSTEQNARLHALLADIAEQKQWDGQTLDTEVWKRLLVGAFCRANGQSVEIYRAIDGQGLEMVYRRTSRMSKQEMSELIEYATAWAIENGVVLHDGVPA